MVSAQARECREFGHWNVLREVFFHILAYHSSLPAAETSANRGRGISAPIRPQKFVCEYDAKRIRVT